ncbi:Sorting nexin-30 [Balamuthia mandrillaris]
MIRNERDDYPRKNKIEGDYQEPEFITITVTEPITHEFGGKKSHTTYQINTQTTFPEYKQTDFAVRRRYSDFVWLRNYLRRKMEESPKGRKKGGTIPPLPGNNLSSLFGAGRFEPAFIEERRVGLEAFLNSVANHVICRFEPGLHAFLQDQEAELEKFD